MSTKASAVIQDLTFTEKTLGLGVTISYTDGGTAGSEVVSVSSHAITIQIQGGTSTATQIKAAFDASFEATLLATCTISGTGSNAQKTCNGAFLSGGAAVAKSTLTVGSMLLTSVANGGTAIRFKFTTGATAGSEVITVSTNDITCQIEEGVSTYTQVKAAIDGDTGAHALVLVSSSGKSLGNVARLAHCSAFTNLAGGVAAAVAATLVKQDLTLTAATAGVAGNLISLTYTTGAVAGSEVVTVVGNAISIQISNGVSTATQIKAAFDAAGSATALAACSISGTGSNAQKTVNAQVTSGAAGDGARAYYVDNAGTALTSSFVAFPFSCKAGFVGLYNDETSGAKGVVYSWDGVTTHGTLLFGAKLELQNANTNVIYLKYVSAAPAYRLSVKETR